MAVEEKVISKKKPKSRNASEEVVIKIGKTKEDEPEKETTEKAEEIRFDEELERELEKEDIESELEEEEGEEVVISIGKPPKEVEKPKEKRVKKKKKEEPVEAEVVEEEEEGEVEEEEAEEEEAPDRRKIAAVIIAVIIILASIGTYLLFFQNQDPVAKLSLRPDTATTGELITVDGSNSSDDKEIVEYTFYFGDNTVYSENKDNAPDGEFDGIRKHYYSEANDYTVELRVKDQEGRTSSAEKQITITELEVTIPMEKLGDNCTYDVWGSVLVENDDGLWTGSSEQGKFTLKEIAIDYTGHTIMAVENAIQKQDGFKKSHETLQRYTYELLDLEGSISGTVELAMGGQLDTTFDIQDGELEVADKAYTDLTTNKTIYSFTKSYLSVTAAADLGIESRDWLHSYSNLREEPAVFRVEDISPDRTFDKHSSGTENLGTVAYSWDVEGATAIRGYPALQIDVEIDRDTMSRNNIEEFDMKLWVTNEIPFPIQTKIYVKIYSEGTTILAWYNNTIQDNGYTKGNLPILYGVCPGSSSSEHYLHRNPGYEFIPWDNDDYIPKKGGNSTSFKFDPQEAITHARSNSGTFNNYLNNNPHAYVVDGYYNDTTDGPPTWNLTFGEFFNGVQDETGYYIVVDYDGGSFHIIDEDSIDLPELINETSDFNPILSFSASEQLFKSDEEINSAAFDPDPYGIKFTDGFSYGARANMIYPSLSITVSLTVERAEYGYYLYDEDGSFAAAVDGINGQLIYIWEHEGDDVLSMISG